MVKRAAFLSIVMFVAATDAVRPEAADTITPAAVRITFTRPAFEGMPIWLTVETKNPYKIHYPCSWVPSDFGCNTVEVQQEGRLLSPIIRLDPAGSGGMPCGHVSAPGSPESRLPVHLQYPSLLAGVYCDGHLSLR